MLEVHTCRHTTSFVLVCLYAFKRSSLHALLCPFILYMHTYGFLFMRFVLYAEEDMQPEGLNFRNRVWRSLAKPRPDFPMCNDKHPKWCYFRIIFILNYEVSPLRVMPLMCLNPWVYHPRLLRCSPLGSWCVLSCFIICSFTCQSVISFLYGFSDEIENDESCTAVLW